MECRFLWIHREDLKTAKKMLTKCIPAKWTSQHQKYIFTVFSNKKIIADSSKKQCNVKKLRVGQKKSPIKWGTIFICHFMG